MHEDQYTFLIISQINVGEKVETHIGGSVVDNVPPVTGLIGWRSVVELRRLRLVLMSGRRWLDEMLAGQNCGGGRWTGKPREQQSRAYARCRDDS